MMLDIGSMEMREENRHDLCWETVQGTSSTSTVYTTSFNGGFSHRDITPINVSREGKDDSPEKLNLQRQSLRTIHRGHEPISLDIKEPKVR